MDALILAADSSKAKYKAFWDALKAMDDDRQKFTASSPTGKACDGNGTKHTKQDLTHDNLAAC